jgi:hypothetical protein
MKKLKAKEDKTIIAAEEDKGAEYLCSFCNIVLVRLRDSSQQNNTYWCKHCSVEFDPEAENLRKQSKIVVPDRNEEAAITSIQNIPDVSIKKEVELRGGFAELQKKGTIRFTSYQTTEKE